MYGKQLEIISLFSINICYFFTSLFTYSLLLFFECLLAWICYLEFVNGYVAHQNMSHYLCARIFLVGLHHVMGFSGENDIILASKGKTNQKVAGII